MSHAVPRSAATSPRALPLPLRLLALFLLGAIVVSFFDGFHTHSGTTRYPHPWRWEMAPWVPLLFGASVGIGGPVYAALYPKVGGSRPPPPTRDLAIGFVVFGALYFSTGFWAASSPAKLALLLAAAVVLHGWLDRTLPGFLLSLGVAVVGPCVEATLVHTGAFEYLHPDAFGVPMWLPALYLCSGPVLGQLARKVLLFDEPSRRDAAPPHASA